MGTAVAVDGENVAGGKQDHDGTKCISLAKKYRRRLKIEIGGTKRERTPGNTSEGGRKGEK